MTDDLTVSSVGNRITVQDKTTDNTFVYYIDGEYFVRQSCPVNSNIVSLLDIETPGAPNIEEYEEEYREIAISEPEILWWDDAGATIPGDPSSSFYTYEFSVVDWNLDHSGPSYVAGIESPAYSYIENDPRSTTSPRLKILSQPLDPGSPFTDNRMNELLISGYMRSQEVPANSPLLNVSLVNGRGTFVDELEGNEVLEYGFNASDLDTTQRIGIAGTRSTPASRVLIEEADTVDNDPARDLRIYGIGAEFLEDFTYGNDS
jgi:hypothetical protein